MGISEPAPRVHTPPKRKSRLFPIVMSLGLLAVVALVTVGYVRGEGERIGICARDAIVLSKVSEIVRSGLYPDTDNFLGKYVRLGKEEALSVPR